MSAARVVFWVSLGSLVTVLVLDRVLRLGTPLFGAFSARLDALSRKARAGEPLGAHERRAWMLHQMLSPVFLIPAVLPDRWIAIANPIELALLALYVLTVARLPTPPPPASPPSS